MAGAFYAWLGESGNTGNHTVLAFSCMGWHVDDFYGLHQVSGCSVSPTYACVFRTGYFLFCVTLDPVEYLINEFSNTYV